MTRTAYTVGWDIGGAHVKMAVLDDTGHIVDVVQQPCPLWKGLTHLHQAVRLCLAGLPQGRYQHALTMTGELVDLFAGRDAGVEQIIAAMRQLLPNDVLSVFAGRQGLLDATSVTVREYPDIASANWLAGAQLAAQRLGDGLYIDIGSTTTDILALRRGEARVLGYTDYQRLISQELVYTGIVRTAVMAVVQTVSDGDRQVGVMAEYFATMADVYRLTGELNEAHDQADTADGAEKTPVASARRLSRMIGCDFHHDELPRWRQLAFHIRGQQLRKIQDACLAVINPTPLDAAAPIIGAGIGRFLAQDLAHRLARPYRDFSTLCPSRNRSGSMDAADCAPAVAVACLLLARN